MGQTQQNKFQLGQSFSSVNVTTKNGYLFAKRVHRPKTNTHYTTQRGPATNMEMDSEVEFTDRTMESSACEKPTIRLKVDKKFGSRYKYFQSLPKYSTEQPCINCASKYVGKEDEVYRLQDLEKKKHWLLKAGFQKYPGAPEKEKFKEFHYVSADPSKPPMLHQFRDEDKETYIFGNFKKNV